MTIGPNRTGEDFDPLTETDRQWIDAQERSIDREVLRAPNQVVSVLIPRGIAGHIATDAAVEALGLRYTLAEWGNIKFQRRPYANYAVTLSPEGEGDVQVTGSFAGRCGTDFAANLAYVRGEDRENFEKLLGDTGVDL